MPEAEYLVQSAATHARVLHPCRQLSSLPMYSSNRWISNQSNSNVQTHGTWLCLSQHVLQIAQGVYILLLYFIRYFLINLIKLLHVLDTVTCNILFRVPSGTVLKKIYRCWNSLSDHMYEW